MKKKTAMQSGDCFRLVNCELLRKLSRKMVKKMKKITKTPLKTIENGNVSGLILIQFLSENCQDAS